MLGVRKFAVHDRSYVGVNGGLRHQHAGFDIAALRSPRASPAQTKLVLSITGVSPATGRPAHSFSLLHILPR